MIMRDVQADQVDAVWPRVAPLLRQFRAKYDDTPTLGALYDLLIEGHRQMYVVIDGGDLAAVILTQISADGKKMEVPCVAGSGADGWAEGVLSNLEQMAAANGIETLQLYPRPGWIKLLSLTEYREVHRVYERKLSNGR